ncbi:MoaD/ThiS family protein [Flavobacteriaceae bacterium AU392]|nr:MoaD/ThiS family protein [Flavobacteriaceae bacterium]RKM84187.1 MoaD/ThiS family protein [Flavobacteriaceae bacterium AU392]
MTITIKYFGLLSEVTQCNEEVIECTKTSISGLLNILFNKHPELKHKDFQVAQHQEIASKEDLISSNEIALLPPFAGG